MPANTPGTVTTGCANLPVTIKWDPSTGAMISVVVVNNTGAAVSSVSLIRSSDGFVWKPTIPTGTTTITAAQLSAQGINTNADLVGIVLVCPNG